ncbi:hypothetical protein [Nocardia goodfellowii]|uniref:DUF8175 domain-containing protein n=1 Tax=Nocardia goodfellowii TaxID=882446 RepID=A0ABS4QG16_9NOCA|nr:hypothetical protein [Nocardia goodfellowii]MBP2190638.1 hypothetical protein [Nocardia goodfellowii]
MVTRGPRGNPRRSRLTLLGLAAAVAVLVAVGVTVSALRDNPEPDDARVLATNASSGPLNGTTAAPAPAPLGFAGAAVDVFGRRVDIPNNPAGQALPQHAGQQRTSADPDWLTAAPVGTRGEGGWQRVYGVSVPFSTSDGPARIEDGLALGYSRTPQGAILAGAQIMYRANARPADRKLRARQMVLTAQEQATYARKIAEGGVPEQLPESASKWLVASDAFRIENYTPERATMRIATRAQAGEGGGNRWVATQLAVVWIDGDWRLQSVPGPDGRPQTETITTLTGWTPW